MKWKAIIVLLAIALGILVPPSLPFLSHHGAMETIGVLDVCHSTTSALSTNCEMPCVHGAATGHLLPLGLLDISQIENQRTKPCFIAYQEERPPKSLL